MEYWKVTMKTRILISIAATFIATITPGAILAAGAKTIEPDHMNRSAMQASEKPLQTRIPDASDKRPAQYVLELNATQSVRAMGAAPVQEVARPLERIDTALPGRKGEDSADVEIQRPEEEALVPVGNAFSPFSLEAKYFEKIGLRDALEASIGRNLDIQEGFARLKTRKFAYLSEASDFLPSINAGYDLFGVSGSIPGALLGGGSGSTRLPSSLQLLTAGFSYKAYQGGKVLFGTLEQRHRYKAAHAELKGDVNDVLLDTSRRYYDLLLNEVLLAIRTRAVAISKEQVRVNITQEREGAATGLDVLQSQAQLASDEQDLVDQQNNRRQSAIQLAHLINTSFAMDLASDQVTLKKKRLVPEKASVDSLITIAVEKRPELKQYEELRLAARRSVGVAQAPLQPTVALNGGVYGIGAQGTGITPIYTLNLGVKWSLGGLGAKDLANIQKAKWEARQSAIKAQKAFLDVYKEVRSSFDTSMASDRRIERASIQIDAAREELRIAKKRMAAGIGLNIDVLNAQRDYTQASINKARAIVDFNIAQVQLVRDVGAISVSSLLNGIGAI